MTDSLNERIARVKGWRPFDDAAFDENIQPTLDGSFWISGDGEGRRYDWSGSIADAWELVEEMTAKGHESSVHQFSDYAICWAGFEACENAPVASEAIAKTYLAVMEKADT